MLNKSIAYRLSIYISVATIGVFIAFMIISFLFNSKIVNENIENYAYGESQKVIMEVEEQLIATREITSNIANQIIFYAQNNHPELLIGGILKKYPFINAIHINIDSVVPSLRFHNYLSYYNNKDSLLLEQKNEIIYECPNLKRVINEAALKETPGWTEVSVCPRTNKSIMSYYNPIYLDNKVKQKVVGEVICELSLQMLNESINDLDILNNGGYAFFTSKDGTYLTHPREEWINKRTVFTVPDGVYNKNEINMAEALKKGRTYASVVYPEYRNYEKYWGYFTPIKEAKWVLFFALPYKELYAPLFLATLRMLFFAVLGILVVYLIITYLTNKLIEPLNTATSQLKKFSSLTGEAEIDTLDEVEQVSGSLSQLKSWYDKYREKESRDKEQSNLRLQDLIEASEIQQSLIKTDFNTLANKEKVDIFAIYKPARIVSGDLFDYFYIDDDHLIFTMGDVSGKGVPAAFFMSVAQTIIKSNATIISANRIVQKANNELFTTNRHQFFLTLFLGVLNIKTGVLMFCNAAHTPTYVLKLNGDVIELSQSHGLPLGIYPNKKYSNSKITLEKGDSIVLYTDGITELQNEQKVHFGNERFVENLRVLVEFEPKNLVSRIEQSLEIYRGQATQVDDITLMAIKYKA
jgi:sigma-B regulation protein RsbU (phosphoserine phosphatase)